MTTPLRTSPSGPLAGAGISALYWGETGIDTDAPFMIPWDTGLVSSTANIHVAQIPILVPCTLKNLFACATSGTISGNDVTLTVLLNGEETDLAATIAAGESSAFDDEHEVSCVRGDLISVSVSTAGASVAGLMAGVEVT